MFLDISIIIYFYFIKTPKNITDPKESLIPLLLIQIGNKDLN